MKFYFGDNWFIFICQIYLLSIAMKQHVWAIESYNYSNGTVKAARAICPGNPDSARWNQQADVRGAFGK